MRIVVTGAAGFIGSHLTKNLIKRNNRVIGIDNFDSFYSTDVKCRNVLESTGKENKTAEVLASADKIEKVTAESSSSNYQLYYGDIRDMQKLDEIFKKEQPELVINLAGLAGVRPSLERPLEYEDVNVRGTMNLLELCRKYNIKKFIQASSSSVYGNNKSAPFKETNIVDFAVSPYAATKKSCEVMGHVYHSLYGIDMFQLRFFTVYGERQRPDLAIHKFVKMISEGKKIPFYGDGKSCRDYTYISDIIQGIVKSIEYLQNNSGIYEILNLGGGHTVTLKEMVEEIESALGIKADIDYLPMQPGDVNRTDADITKGERLIGYKPEVSFHEGIKRFVSWYRGV